jgi:hypothetical protein
MKTPKPRPGKIGTLIGVRLQANILARIDEWRKSQPDLPTRPEAIRQLVEKGLAPPAQPRGKRAPK